MSFQKIMEITTAPDRAEVMALRRQGVDPTDYLNRRAAESSPANGWLFALVIAPVAAACVLGAILG